MKKWLYGIILFFVVLIAMMGGFMVFYLADIRPEELKEQTAFETSAISGLDLLHQVQVAHGMDLWKKKTTTELWGVDDWVDFMGNLLVNPFLNSKQQIRIKLLNDTWDSNIQLVENLEVIETWGIQAWNSYRILPGENPKFESDEDIDFFLPTYQYFMEFPFRIQTAEFIIQLPEKRIDKIDYERIFATWKSMDATDQADQYIIWIDKESKLIHRIEYTVREYGNFTMGSTYFLNYSAVDSIMIPHQLNINAIMPGGLEILMHQIYFDSVKFDSFDGNLLKPNPKLVHTGQKH